jgi:hypothetical protein
MPARCRARRQRCASAPWPTQEQPPLASTGSSASSAAAASGCNASVSSSSPSGSFRAARPRALPPTARSPAAPPAPAPAEPPLTARMHVWPQGARSAAAAPFQRPAHLQQRGTQRSRRSMGSGAPAAASETAHLQKHGKQRRMVHQALRPPPGGAGQQLDLRLARLDHLHARRTYMADMHCMPEGHNGVHAWCSARSASA